jgi:hypothetical protein
MNRYGWLLVIVLLLYGCNGMTQPEQSKRAQDKTAQNLIVINYGRQVAAAKENLTLKFVAILEDSRCPEGVQCVWAGNARIELAVTKTGEDTASLELNTNDRFPIEAQYLGYLITLIDLQPYPKATKQISLQDYTVNVEIRKP